MPQPQPRQQSRFNEIQMLQRQIMFKQLQELQRQQQFQELGDGTQDNSYINQQSLINRQASGSQVSHPVNGTPVRDPSQMLTFGNGNLVQHGVQGFPNGLVFQQAQTEALLSMGLVSQQLEGTPIATTGNSLSQYSHFHGASHDTGSVLTKDNSDQAEKPRLQSSVFSKSFMNDQYNVSDGAFIPKQVLQEKNLFGQVLTQGVDSGVQPGTLQQVNNLKRNASLQQFGGSKEQGGWPGVFSGKITNIGSSQGLASLDPLEQKILFNMDDNSWEASFGRRGGFENMFERTDQLSAFPSSVQSGSWSALMQSAVAEASRSDTGLQEEWSGLSFQNLELSNDNQPSNFVESGKQPTNWLDNNLQGASSLTSKPDLLFKNSNASSSFPGFHHYSGNQFPFQQKEVMRSGSSHESIQQSHDLSREWLGGNAQQKLPPEGNESVQQFSPSQSAWPVKFFERLESDTHQQSISAYTNDAQPCTTVTGRNIESPSPSDRNNFQLNHFTDAPKSSTSGVGWESSRHLPESQQLDYMNRADRRSKNSFQRENSSGSYHSNASQHTIAGLELRENARLHESDSCPVLEGNQKPSGQVPQGPSGHEQGHVGEFEFIGNGLNNAMDFEKGCLLGIQRNSKASDEAPPGSNIGSSMSAFFDRSAGFHSPNLNAQTSQNMLELLHKVDNSTEYSPGTYFGSTDSTPISEVPQREHPDPSFARLYNKSSASQYFGLRLAPPTQRPPNSDYFESSQISPHTENSTSEYDRNLLHNQITLTRQSPQATLSDKGSRLPAFSPATSLETSHVTSANPYGQHFPIFEAKQVTQPPTTSGMSQQVAFSMRPPNVWIDVPTHQNPSGMESRNVPLGLLPTSDATNRRPETTSGAPKELGKQNYFEGGNFFQEMGACLVNSQGFDYAVEKPAKARSRMHTSEEALDSVSKASKVFHGKDSSAGYLSEANAVSSGSLVTTAHQLGSDGVRHSGNQSPAISGRDLEAFGCSLKQSHVGPPEKSSLLNPIHSDPRNRVSVNHSRDDFQSHSFGNDVASNETERSQISFPMAPSWFKNHGTLKNGQMLPLYDASIANNAAQQFSIGKPFESLNMNSSLVQAATSSVAAKHKSSPYMLDSDITDQNLVVLRPKKRKFPTFDLLPWRIEASQGSSRLQNISTAELEWAHAVNRLTKKLKDEAESIGDSLRMVHPKKRLILTTQLMQLLFRPVPAVILSEDATSHCDAVAYFAARLALGDACSLASHSHLPRDISDLSSGKNSTSESIRGRDFSKFVEDFINRSKRLEGELLRLKGGSILDITVESQDLEKFSVMNRLAKFHSRGLVGAAETTFPSATTSTVPRLYPQRYVTASPMPRTVPEGTQCLSL